MITVFNRKELLVTTNMEEFARVRDILAQNRIEYDIKVNDSTDQNWGHSSQLGINRDFASMYYIYVREREYDEAGNIVTERYYGADEKQIPCKEGYDEVHRTAEGMETYYLLGKEFVIPEEDPAEEESKEDE